jgi:sugar phosphate permease
VIAFLLDNRRWLGAGFLLTFTAAFGQTWFISLFAGEIKSAHGLTDGGWGSLYTVATLSSAALLFARGALADTMPLARLAPVMALLFALSAVAMAFAGSVWTLGIAVFGLRFCGQGMFGHIAMTAMGRWFRARRGRAVATATLGHPAGEFVIPLLAVLAISAFGGRATWLVVAALLALLVAPSLALLLARGRTPEGSVEGAGSPGLRGLHWTRADTLRHWLFPALLPMMLTGGFIGTVVYFHMVHIAEVKGWTLTEMAPGYPTYAVLSVAGAVVGGWAVDRFGAERLLPVFLLPMGLGITLIGPASAVPIWFVALGCLGLTQGLSSALWGAILPALYGTRHLGAVRSLVSTVMVVSTAIGPGVTGILIDAGVDFPRQCLAMGLWCLALSAAGLPILRGIRRETPA